MSDESPMVAPSGAPVRKRRLWPWILGGAVLLVLLAVGVVVAILAVRFLAPVNEKESVEQAVIAFDKAYEDADCDLFEKVTSSTVRDDIVGEDYTCAEWRSIAEALTIDGEYAYSVTILESMVDGDEATVTTDETYNADQDDEVKASYNYSLERTGDGWIITEYFPEG